MQNAKPLKQKIYASSSSFVFSKEPGLPKPIIGDKNIFPLL